MSGVVFLRMYPTDWRSGCFGLSLEQEGLYIRMCMFVAETGRRVPLDDTEAARMMGIQTRNYRRVLGELLRLGKIKRHDDGYGNDRIEYERDRANDKTKQDSKPSPAPAESPDRQTNQGQEREDHAPPLATTPDLTANYSRSNGVITGVAEEIPQSLQCPSIEPVASTNKKETVVEDASAKVVPISPDWRVLQRRLTEAAGKNLMAECNAPGLAVMATPLRWLNGGCDLEIDVLPTVKHVAAKSRSKIVSWDYFTQAVVDARHKRLTPLPDATVTAPEFQHEARLDIRPGSRPLNKQQRLIAAVSQSLDDLGLSSAPAGYGRPS